MRALSSEALQLHYQGRNLMCVLSRSKSRLLWGADIPLTLCEDKVSMLASDQAGTVIFNMADDPPEQRYTAYGYREGVGGMCRFTGQRLDEASGGYHLGQGHRMYSPRLMRFVSADMLSPFSDGGINAYAYCAGDPINRKDPDGTASKWIAIFRPLTRRIVQGGRTTQGQRQQGRGGSFEMSNYPARVGNRVVSSPSVAPVGHVTPGSTSDTYSGSGPARQQNMRGVASGPDYNQSQGRSSEGSVRQGGLERLNAFFVKHDAAVVKYMGRGFEFLGVVASVVGFGYSIYSAVQSIRRKPVWPFNR
jgi:RHS repeat-associated protein